MGYKKNREGGRKKPAHFQNNGLKKKRDGETSNNSKKPAHFQNNGFNKNRNGEMLVKKKQQAHFQNNGFKKNRDGETLIDSKMPSHFQNNRFNKNKNGEMFVNNYKKPEHFQTNEFRKPRYYEGLNNKIEESADFQNNEFKRSRDSEMSIYQRKEPVHLKFDEYGENEIINDDSNLVKKWFDTYKDEMDEECPQLPKDEVEKLKIEAKKLLDTETTLHNIKNSKGSNKSEYGWIQTIMNKGTVADRIAAHAIAIQDAPLYTLPLLKNLVSMAKASTKNECIEVLGTIAELFLSDLLRPDMKLRVFENCPLALLDKYSSGNHVSRKNRLIHWYYEDQLKEVFSKFIASLHAAAQDTIENTKEKAISAMYKLLAGNPEQESALLRSIINKMGDPSRKVASKAMNTLIQLLRVHPNMKYVVLEETEKFLFRSNVGQKAQHFSISFLAQFILSREEKELAKSLLLVYFSFFKACVKKGEVDSRLMNVLLIGANRAYPYAKEEMHNMVEYIDTMYRMVHITNFNVSLHTLSLIFQVTDFASTVSDRFYCALYKKILDPELATSSQQALFLSLVFKTLTRDENVNRVKVFLKRLLQVCCYMPVPMICGILFMVSHLFKKKINVLTLKMKSASNIPVIEEKKEVECFEDVKVEGADDIKTNIQQGEIDENENKEDMKTNIHQGEILDENEEKKENNTVNQSSEIMETNNKESKYDPMLRNPSYAGGEHCVHNELVKLSQHFHPTVALFATTILQGGAIKESGDPLEDYSLPKFLERFVFKNPKKIIKEKFPDQHKFSRKKRYVPRGMKSLRVNSANYLSESGRRIPVEEFFMYRYLTKKRADQTEKMKDRNVDDDDDVSSVGSDEFNDMLDDMMKVNEDLDFAEDVTRSKSMKKDADSEDEDEIDDNDDDGDDEVTGSENEGEGNEDDYGSDFDDDGDDDEEDIAFGDSDSDVDLDDDDDDAVEYMPNEKRKKSKAMRKGGRDDLFMSAEEFSEMLDNIGASGLKSSGSSAFSNADKADTKQLNWEASRDFWLNKKGKESKKNQMNKRKWNSHPGDSGSGRNTKKRRKR